VPQSLLVVSVFSSVGSGASFTLTFSEAGNTGDNDNRHEFCRIRHKGGRSLFQIIFIFTWHSVFSTRAPRCCMPLPSARVEDCNPLQFLAEKEKQGER